MRDGSVLCAARLNLLMESAPPGSVPDAPMVAAAFTLVRTANQPTLT